MYVLTKTILIIANLIKSTISYPKLLMPKLTSLYCIRKGMCKDTNTSSDLIETLNSICYFCSLNFVPELLKIIRIERNTGVKGCVLPVIYLSVNFPPGLFKRSGVIQ